MTSVTSMICFAKEWSSGETKSDDLIRHFRFVLSRPQWVPRTGFTDAAASQLSLIWIKLDKEAVIAIHCFVPIREVRSDRCDHCESYSDLHLNIYTFWGRPSSLFGRNFGSPFFPDSCRCIPDFRIKQLNLSLHCYEAPSTCTAE